MAPLTPYISFLYFALLLYPLVPAALLGLTGRLGLWYVLLASAGMIWLQYDDPFSRVPEPRHVADALAGLWHTAPQLVLLLAFTAFELVVMLAYAAVRRRGNSRWLYYLAVGLALTPLALVKFYPLLTGQQQVFGLASSPTQALLAPGLADAIGFVGMSYVTFRAVDVIINLRDGLIDRPGVGLYLAFLLFFPTLSAGPIDRIHRFSGDWRRPRTRSEYLTDMDSGFYRLAQGFLYKFLIADWIWMHWLLPAAGQHGALGLLSYMYAYSLYLFFDFAGYSAFAIGVSRFLGVHTPENFRAPFLSRNFKDFWNRWFLTLSFWLRDHVYMRFVLGATRRKLFRNKYAASYIGYLITMGLMGLWHGPQANYLAYGLYQGIMLICSDYLARWNQRRQLLPDNSLTRALSVLLTVNLVCFGLLIFSGRLFT